MVRRAAQVLADQAVCETDDACKPLVPEDGPYRSLGGSGDDEPRSEAVCYKGGFAVKEIHQMCDVTSLSQSERRS